MELMNISDVGAECPSFTYPQSSNMAACQIYNGDENVFGFWIRLKCYFRLLGSFFHSFVLIVGNFIVRIDIFTRTIDWRKTEKELFQASQVVGETRNWNGFCCNNNCLFVFLIREPKPWTQEVATLYRTPCKRYKFDCVRTKSSHTRLLPWQSVKAQWWHHQFTTVTWFTQEKHWRHHRYIWSCPGGDPKIEKDYLTAASFMLSIRPKSVAPTTRGMLSRGCELLILHNTERGSCWESVLHRFKITFAAKRSIRRINSPSLRWTILAKDPRSQGLGQSSFSTLWRLNFSTFSTGNCGISPNNGYTLW